MKPIHIFFAIGISIIWGANFAITKFAMQDMPPLFFAALRYSIIAFPLIFFVKRDKLSWRLILNVGFFLGICSFGLVFIGLKLGVPSGVAALLMQGQIIFAVLLSTLVLKEKPSMAMVAGVAISAAGVIYLILHGDHGSSLLGFLIVLAASFCACVSKIIMRQEGNDNPFRLIIWMSAVPPIPMFALSMMFETGQWNGLMDINLEIGSALLYNSFISTFLGIGLTGYLLKLYSVNQVVPFTFLVPVFSFIAGYLLLGEAIDRSSVIASVVIIGGLMLPKLKAITSPHFNKKLSKV